MPELLFDTHAFIKRMTDAGMPPQQAEALAYEQLRILSDNLATKSDLASVRLEIEGIRLEIERVRHEIKELEVSLRRDMKKLEYRLLLKLAAMGTASIGIIATLVRIL